MVKKCFLLLMLLLASFFGISQNRQDIDSLNHELSSAGNDTSSSLILSAIAYELRNSNPDSSVLLCSKALELARSHQYYRGEARALHTLASTKRIQGNFPTAMDLAYQGLEMAPTMAMSGWRQQNAAEANSLIFCPFININFNLYK